ncbi:hypothetical protein H4R21_000961 [Coemansia helicoidea]|uniref:Uncharacterized protein n=1 Tax=Coemansia helicoidea TaxID=1286919 RepID=A0ACC1LEU9_9FUNG|nr:hypothetical protein H4R21_000961 [Coemansia helicoidea]
MSWPKLQRLKRDAVEQDLVFLGLLVFENKLKPTTAPVLDELRGANIRQIMCTGDNVLTAISVGRECGLIPSGMAVYVPRLVRMREAAPGHTHSGGGSGSGSSACAPAEVRAMVVWEDPESATRVLDPYTLEPRAAASPAPEHLVESDAAETPDEMARQQEQYLAWMHSLTSADVGLATSGNYCVAITGEVFRFVMDALPETTVGRALMRGAIYARMSPDEKAELIESLQRIGYCAGFCGDGANDCGALRAADVGISLSEAEASVAAPFTSHSTDIRCVLEAIREGRAALVTSFSCFKFMALYSIIQFTSVSMLYEFGGGLGDLQFLFIDLFIIIPLAVFMGRTPAFDRIVPKRPTANLMSKKVLTSLFGQIVVNAAIQTAVFRLVKRSAGYTPPTRADPADRDTLLVRSFENSALFLASSFQYVIVGCVFSIGPPYRQSNLHNKGFVATCVALVLFTAYLTLRPDGWCTRVFEMVELSSAFRRVIAGCAVANLALCVVGEAWLFPRMAPAVARYGRIVQYLVRRYVLGRRRLQYDQLPAADSATARAPPAAHAGPAHTATGKRLPEGISAGEASPAGSPSGTVGGGGGSDAYDLESARRMPSWDEIGQKTETKPFKRILREMGIPVRY